MVFLLSPKNRGPKGFASIPVIRCAALGVEQTRVGAVLGRKAEPRHAVHPMRAGHGREDCAREGEKELGDTMDREATAFWNV